VRVAPKPNLNEMAFAFFNSTKKGWRAAASFLADSLQHLLDVQNPHGTGKNARGSDPGTHPYRKSGEGRKNIGFQILKNGFRVGGNDKNFYLWMHDIGIRYRKKEGGGAGFQQRPWFVAKGTWHIYREEMLRIMRRHAKRGPRTK
jgi:hypothetical protein